MRLAIISDVHANLEALHATLHDISTRAVDGIVCLGDIVGYNANPAECIALLRNHGALCVAGNHDRAVCGQITTDGFGVLATRAVLWTLGKLGPDAMSFLAELPLKAVIADRLIAVHGALHPETGCEMVRLDNDDQRRASFDALVKHPSKARMCAFGHTHLLGIFELRGSMVRSLAGDEIPLSENGYYLVNPGSVGQPRISDPRATYLILDTARWIITIVRVEYDRSVSLAKARRAGLRPPLSFLPAPVRAMMRRGVSALGLYDVVKKGWIAGSHGRITNNH
jgi:predicted phosphodiesterase